MSAVAFRANVISSRDQALHIIISRAAGPGVVYVVAGSGGVSGHVFSVTQVTLHQAARHRQQPGQIPVISHLYRVSRNTLYRVSRNTATLQL